MPTLLATSPLAATRSQPTITASAAPPRIRPGAAPSTTSSCGMPARPSSQTVSRAPCSSGRVSQTRTSTSPAALQRADDRERRAGAAGGERPRVAVGDDPPGAGEQLGAGDRDRRARRVLLGVDQLRFAARRRRHPRRPRAQRRGAHAVDGPREVDRRRPRRAQLIRGALERPQAGQRRELHRDAVRRGDADQRRAADRQAPDRRGGVGSRPSARATPPRRAAASGRAHAGARRPSAARPARSSCPPPWGDATSRRGWAPPRPLRRGGDPMLYRPAG